MLKMLPGFEKTEEKRTDDCFLFSYPYVRKYWQEILKNFSSLIIPKNFRINFNQQ